MNTHQTNLRQYVSLIAGKHGGLAGLSEIIDKKLPPRWRSRLESMETGPASNVAAVKALESLERAREPTQLEMSELEAIIKADLRPVIDVVDGKYNSTHPLWPQLSTDAAIRDRLESCMASIGRIELPGHPRLPYGGTGFIVGSGLLMTNRHVAEIFVSGLGTRVAFRPGLAAGIDFLREQGRPTGPTQRVVRVVMIHPYWDMALLQVEGLDTRRELKLSLTDARDLIGHDIAVVGYPAFDPRNPSEVQQNLFNGRYGVKRLQPGELQGGGSTASFQKLVKAATHDCSTLGGNSGSAIIDLSTGDVLGLHFGGVYEARNYAVPTAELARDQRVVDAGVRFAGEPRPGSTEWAGWWQRADSIEATEADSLPAQDLGASLASPSVTVSTPGTSAIPTVAAPSATLNIEIPICISISIPGGRVVSVQAGVAQQAPAVEALETMREPEHDADYNIRTGYDADFLNSPGQPTVSVPIPEAAEADVVARSEQGERVLHYQNFSVVMHAKRRLALITASNVTREPRLRRPEPGRDYTRKGLSGLGKNDTERWFQDPRLKPAFQIPDAFFTKDRQAFDKGHLVRRDDVAWGRTYKELRRANGDTYHVTNCSPQVSGFNRSADGDLNWGELENHVLAEAASERLCVFAGPVLDLHDQVFHGVGDGRVKILAQIPRRFWKVIVARVAAGIATYGFVLEQDLGDVQFEFAVPEEFAPNMYSLEAIEKLAGIRFDPALRAADQFETVRGIELAQHTGTRGSPSWHGRKGNGARPQ